MGNDNGTTTAVWVSPLVLDESHLKDADTSIRAAAQQAAITELEPDDDGSGEATAVAVNNRTRGSDGMKYVADHRSSKGDDIMPDHRLTDKTSTTTHMELGGFGNVCGEDQP
ncbi:unnamed protein product [Boreogadus saida]